MTTASTTDEETAIDQGRPSPTNTTKQVSSSHEKDVIITLLGLLLLAAVTSALIVGLRDQNDDCLVQRKYKVSFSIHRDGPEIQINDPARSSWKGGSGVSASFTSHIDGPQNSFLPRFGDDGWVDSALEISHVDQQSMDAKVYFQNEREMNKATRFWNSVAEYSEPECEPKVRHTEMWSIPMGGATEAFQLGVCRVFRLDDKNLLPYVIEFTFTGRLEVEEVEVV